MHCENYAVSHNLSDSRVVSLSLHWESISNPEQEHFRDHTGILSHNRNPCFFGRIRQQGCRRTKSHHHPLKPLPNADTMVRPEFESTRSSGRYGPRFAFVRPRTTSAMFAMHLYYLIPKRAAPEASVPWHPQGQKVSGGQSLPLSFEGLSI